LLFGTLIIGTICFLIEKRKSNDNDIRLLQKKEGDVTNEYPEFPLKRFLILIFFWILEEQTIDNFYSYILKDLEFWMIEIIILSLLNYKIYGLEFI